MNGQRAIATAHHSATEAGELMFARGGSAVDAAVAAAAVLAVVYPHNTSLGGDLVALVGQGDQVPAQVTAFGHAPAKVDPAAWGTAGRVPARGPESITVPGAVRGWAHLHERYGRLEWAELFGPAIELAADYRIASSVRHAIEDTVADNPEAERLMEQLFGAEWATATSASNPALAATLTRLAEVGAEDFYTGEIASRLVRYLRTIRPDVEAEDFADLEVVEEEPLTADIAGHRVYTSGPPTQGFALLRFLADVQGDRAGAGGAGGGGDGGSDDTGAEGGGAGGDRAGGGGAGGDRAGGGGAGGDDGSVGGAEVDDAVLARLWLDSFTTSDRLRDSVLADGCDPASLLAADPAAAPRLPAPRGSGDTVGIAASDETLSVSLIQSLYSWFGSLCFDEDTGVLFQSRGSMFSLDPASPQVVRPRTRPPHTLMPVLVSEDSGEIAYVLATMGGKAQAQIHSRLLLSLLRGLSPAEALALPRWISGAAEPGDPDRTVSVESDVPGELVDILLAQADAPPHQVPPWSNEMGHANIIDRRGPAPVAAADPRSDGSAWVG